jgi:hypothetical protein
LSRLQDGLQLSLLQARFQILESLLKSQNSPGYFLYQGFTGFNPTDKPDEFLFSCFQFGFLSPGSLLF